MSRFRESPVHAGLIVSCVIAVVLSSGRPHAARTRNTHDGPAPVASSAPLRFGISAAVADISTDTRTAVTTAVAIQRHAGLPGLSQPGRSFGGLEIPIVGSGADGPSAPRPSGDVGSRHYVQAVGALFRIFDKDGAARTPPFRLSQLFQDVGGACGTSDAGHPTVLYDQFADRWLLSRPVETGAPESASSRCIAVSTTDDPAGTYFLYEYVAPRGVHESLQFGVWADAYSMTSDEPADGAVNARAGLSAFDRTKMLAGDSRATALHLDLPQSFAGMLPADVDGRLPPPAGTPGYFATFQSRASGATADALRLFAFHPDFSSPEASTLGELPESPIAVPAFAPAPDRLTPRFAYRNFANAHESLVVAHTIAAGPDRGAGGVEHTVVRYYELLRSLPGGAFNVTEQATVAPDADSRWAPSVATDREGDLAMSYSATGRDMPPAIRYTGRRGSDPANGLHPGEVVIPAGGAIASPSGRPDVSSTVSVDPADDCTFWLTSAYTGGSDASTHATHWITRIATFRFQNCGASVPLGTIQGRITDAVTGLPIPGATANFSPGGFTAVAGAGGVYQAVVPAGIYSVTVSVSGRAFQSIFGVAVLDGGTVTADFKLPLPPTTGLLTGVVRNAATGAVLAAATVRTPTRVTTTDSTGTYVLSLPAATYTVTATKSGFQNASGAATVLNQSLTTLDLFLLDPVSGTLTGHVRDTSGAPIPSAQVTLSNGQSTTTDATGLYKFVQGPGIYVATVSALGFQPASKSGIQITSLGTTTVDFSMIVSGIVNVLHAFTGASDGAFPSSLLLASDGNFYGTTSAGGSASRGTVFRMTPAGAVTLLHSFTAGADGDTPVGLLLAGDGNFYGMTYYGGSANMGTVFRTTPAGVTTILHGFNGTDGAHPGAGLIQGTDGNFYGSTNEGGSADLGTIVKVTPAGVTTVLHEFLGFTDGAYPAATLVQATDGDFYGSTAGGGSADAGTIFRMSSAGVITVLYMFANGADGYNPNGLIQAPDGTLYGTAYDDSGRGNVFAITLAGAFSVVSTFRGQPFEASPCGPLMVAADGNFYGTSYAGGTINGGSIYRMTTTGALAVQYSFGIGISNPCYGVIQGSDGSFYGTAAAGAAGQGVVYRFVPPPPSVVLTNDPGGANPPATADGIRTNDERSPAPAGSTPVSPARATLAADSRGLARALERWVTVNATTTNTVRPAPGVRLIPPASAVAALEMVAASVASPAPALRLITSQARIPDRPAAPARPLAPRRGWELELFGGGMQADRLTEGVAALPGAGDSFTTATGQPSRRVASWYFGDGARLLNDVNAAMGVSARITPLDGLLTTAASELHSGGGAGVRVSHTVTSRLRPELTVMWNPISVRLTDAGATALEAVRASFESAWTGLASAGQFGTTIVSSIVNPQSTGRGRQIMVTGAINVALPRVGPVFPHLTAGGGAIAYTMKTYGSALTGDYQFTVGGVTPVHERDVVRVFYPLDRRVAVMELGGGARYFMSPRTGLRFDWRAYVSRNGLNTRLETNPVISKLTPAGSGASLTNPGLQFSNDTAIGLQSNLSAPRISDFTTFIGTGLRTTFSVTVGVFWR